MSKFKRVMLKLSGEALSGDKGFGFDEATVLTVAEQVKTIVDMNVQVGIVIGGGNFWRGRSNPNMDRTKADQIGMLATVMNCLYAAEMFRTIGIKASVHTPFKFGTVTKEFSKDCAVKSMEEGEVVFFAGGTGHPFFSTDTGVVLRALEVEADILLLGKNIDGVYSDDPKTNKDAKKYDKITLQEVVDQQLKVIDLTATMMCLEHKLPMIVFYLNEEDSIIHAIDEKINGTYIYS